MKGTMQVVVYGGESGTITDKDTGLVTAWAALHVAHSLVEKGTFGMKTSRMKCAPEVISQLGNIKVGTEIDASFEMNERTIEGRKVQDVKILSASVRKAA